MQPADKSAILSRAQTIVANKVQFFRSKIANYQQKIEELRKLAPELLNQDRDKVDPGTEEGRLLFAKAEIREDQVKIMKELQDSPFFARLEAKFDDEKEDKELFISKHPWLDESIYSWVSPVATLRFEQPGAVSYTKPDNTNRSGELKTKENYIITGGEIAYLTHENKQHERQIIYQKHLSERKQFALPEIVAELEKAQDQIIRTKPEGGLLISGAAGSGKTTLALHRIAYLVYAPELREFFEPDRTMVFVADQSGINYFSQLLPELGIEGVRVNTFSRWAVELVNTYYRTRVNSMDHNLAANQLDSWHGLPPRMVYDVLRQAKLTATDLATEPDLTIDQLFEFYTDMVPDKFKGAMLQLIKFQRDFNYVDEIDIALLMQPYPRPTKSFKHIVVDEVQNWTVPQLNFLGQIVENTYKSITYVGDVRQRTRTFAVSGWEQLQMDYPIREHVELTKVYRNTKQVLAYLQNLGYKVNPDITTKEGPDVKEVKIDNKIEQIRHLVERVMQENPGKQIGILAKYYSSLQDYQNFDWPNHVHCLSVEDAQGLEFDTVIIVDSQELKRDYTELEEVLSPSYIEEFAKVNSDLFYVAATRAERELIVTL